MLASLRQEIGCSYSQGTIYTKDRSSRSQPFQGITLVSRFGGGAELPVACLRLKHDAFNMMQAFSMIATSTYQVQNLKIMFNVTNLLSVLDTTSTLLTMSRSKLVSNLRDSNWTNTNLTELVALRVECQHHLVHYTCFTVAEECAGISFCKLFRCAFQLKNSQIWMESGNLIEHIPLR